MGGQPIIVLLMEIETHTLHSERPSRVSVTQLPLRAGVGHHKRTLDGAGKFIASLSTTRFYQHRLSFPQALHLLYEATNQNF